MRAQFNFNRCLLAVFALLSLGLGNALATPPYTAHYKSTDYQEDYRPQFHFSPQNEWMNDINGLWYQDGVYHMLYQWGAKKRHGGYATSRNLLHWEDKGVALIPQQSFLPEDAPRAFSGDEIYSGSGVIVSGETAEKITGSPKEAMVAIYTGTGVGTCLAWSNDGGASWHNYPENPVANETTGTDPRDPCVIWFEPEKKWVMALYERGTTFYESKDLINWTKTSNLDFGFECPDLFELPLDGDETKMKWVLIDAKGYYLVGQFDGKEFVKEQEDVLLMDVGPDFYAAQSFFPENLPEKKIIQIAWMDSWNNGIGEKIWSRNATFPVEVGLVTHDGKMVVTRKPIAAISELYGKTLSLKDKTLQCVSQGGEALLTGEESKTFDMTAVFDLSEAKTGEIVFQLNNRSLRYDLAKRQLLATDYKQHFSATEKAFDLKPDADGILKIRILLDWSCLEIFGNDGVFSYSEQYRFDPEDERVGLRVLGGEVKLVSLHYNEVKSIWKK